MDAAYPDEPPMTTIFFPWSLSADLPMVVGVLEDLSKDEEDGYGCQVEDIVSYGEIPKRIPYKK